MQYSELGISPWDTSAINQNVWNNALCKWYSYNNYQFFVHFNDIVIEYTLIGNRFVTTNRYEFDQIDRVPAAQQMATCQWENIETREMLETVPHPQEPMFIIYYALAIAIAIGIIFIPVKFLILPLIRRATP